MSDAPKNEIEMIMVVTFSARACEHAAAKRTRKRKRQRNALGIQHAGTAGDGVGSKWLARAGSLSLGAVPVARGTTRLAYGHC